MMKFWKMWWQLYSTELLYVFSLYLYISFSLHSTGDAFSTYMGFPFMIHLTVPLATFCSFMDINLISFFPKYLICLSSTIFNWAKKKNCTWYKIVIFGIEYISGTAKFYITVSCSTCINSSSVTTTGANSSFCSCLSPPSFPKHHPRLTSSTFFNLFAW